MPGQPDSTEEHDKRVVVGLDGSEPSLRALAFAIEEARMRGDVLHVVHAFLSPTMQGVAVPVDYWEDLEKEAEAVIEQALAAVAVDDKQGLPRTIQSVIAERASTALIDASRGAELLVVGSRGLGGFQSLLLGSVSSQCIHHAHCPVTVVQ